MIKKKKNSFKACSSRRAKGNAKTKLTLDPQCKLSNRKSQILHTFEILLKIE